MSSEALHNGAHILLAAGIILFILTVIFAVKFNILHMLRTELAGKKKVPNAEIPPAPVHTGFSPQAESHSDEPVYHEVPIYSPVEEKVKEAEVNATVVVSSHSSEPQANGTVVASRKKKQDTPKDDYVIIENIIVIHGDPNITNI